MFDDIHNVKCQTYKHTNSQVSVDTGISGCSCEVFVFSVWYVLMCSWVSVLLGKSKVDDVH